MLSLSSLDKLGMRTFLVLSPSKHDKLTMRPPHIEALPVSYQVDALWGSSQGLRR